MDRLQPDVPSPKIKWDNFIAVLTVVASAVFTFQGLVITQWQFWVAIGIYLLFIVGLRGWSLPGLNKGQKGALLYMMIGLACAMYVISENTFSATILFFILSAGVVEFLPSPLAYRWLIFFGLVTIAASWWRWNEPWMAISVGLATMGGYFFFGASTTARMRADQASVESQRLLGELQLAHRQLQRQTEQAEELAASEERNRLARELHDTLGHRLTVAAVQLEGAQKLIDRNPKKAGEMIGNVRTQVVDGLGELRNVVATLRTPLIQDLPLTSALTRLCNQFADATDLRIYLELPQRMAEPPAEHRHTIYRAAQELLTNIQRHARAQHVTIRLADLGDVNTGDGLVDTELLLIVEDDGIGMGDAAPEQSYGLRGIQERAQQLGGGLTLEPGDPQGTRVRLLLPLPLPGSLRTQ